MQEHNKRERVVPKLEADSDIRKRGGNYKPNTNNKNPVPKEAHSQILGPYFIAYRG